MCACKFEVSREEEEEESGEAGRSLPQALSSRLSLPGRPASFPTPATTSMRKEQAEQTAALNPPVSHTIPLYTSLTMAGLLGKKFPTPVGMAM